MKKTHIIIAGISILGILALVTVARGIGGGVAAAEDERFRITNNTLTKYLGTDTFVSIPDTVRTIGEEAFADNDVITSVEIPNSVKSISYNAFKNCTALTSIIIPDNVNKVGPGAFEGCTALTTVDIGENVSSWGTGVFTNCDSLAKISVDKDNEYITYYNGAVYNGNMTMLYQVLPARDGDNYVMPDTVEDIDAYAFWNLKNTKNVKISSNVSTIPKYAMSNMGTVENVVIQDTTKGIEEKAFSDNANLKQAAIPYSVKNIDRKAFSGSNSMKIYTTKLSTADTFGNDNNIEVIYKAEYPVDFMDSNSGLEEKPEVGTDDSVINETVVEVTTEVTQESDDAEEVKDASTGGTMTHGQTSPYVHPLDVPESDDVVGKTVIVAGKAVVLMNNHVPTVYGVPDGVKADIITTEQDAAAKNSINISYNKQDSKTIAQRKYYQQKNLTDYKIDENIISVGRLAFAESGLKSIDIPESVETIEYGAFMNCKALSEVTIPDTVSDIGTKAFEKTPWLNDWFENSAESDDDFLIVGDGILLAYRGNAEHVEIPDGVKQIGSEVFKGHSEILDVAIPASVTKICAEAFRNCSSLTGLTGCEGLKTVIRGAFYGTHISESEFLN